MALLRQTFALLLERRTGLRIVEADSRADGRELLADLNGDIALAVVSVDTQNGPHAGLIENLRDLGLPVLAFGLERSAAPLATALDAGADEAISLDAPVSYLIDRAAQLVSSSASQRYAPLDPRLRDNPQPRRAHRPAAAPGNRNQKC